MNSGLCRVLLCTTLHKKTIQYFEFSVIIQLQVFQVHTHWCIRFLFFQIACEEGDSLIRLEYFLLVTFWSLVCVIGFWPWKFANPLQAACKWAPPAVTDCLGLKLQGPRGLKMAFPFELCFCGLELLLHFLSPPQPPSYQIAHGREILCSWLI